MMLGRSANTAAIAPISRIVTPLEQLVKQARADNRRADTSAMQALKGEGIEVFTPDAAEAARWKQVGLDVRQRMQDDDEIGAGLLQVIDTALAEDAAGE